MWQIGCPENLLICGCTRSGKTTFVETLLDNECMWEKHMNKIIYAYGIHNSTVERLSRDHPEVILMEGLPRNLSQPHQIFSPSNNNLLITDDLSTESQNSRDFTNFITRGTNHSNCTLISIEHFLYSDSKERRMQSHHWNQYVLFKNQRAAHQITTLAKQVGKDVQLMKFAYQDAVMSQPFGYLIVDLRLDTIPQMSLLTNVLPGDTAFVYK